MIRFYEKQYPVEWRGSPMDYAKQYVEQGALEIDPEGRIWRVKRMPAGNTEPVWKEVPRRRAEWCNQKGYLGISLGLPGGKKLVFVMAHNLVHEILKGPIPLGMVVDHRDFNPSNNHPDNLEVVTPKENMRRRASAGRYSEQMRRAWVTRRARYGEKGHKEAVV